MKRLTKYIFILITIAFIAIQFIKVERTNPPVTAEINGPVELKDVLKTSCYDCHSNETKWPWYSYVAPISFIIANDVNEGRMVLNFSEWENYDEQKKMKLKEEIWEEVVKEDMPLLLYTFSHPNSKIDFVKKSIIKKWSLGY